MKEKQEVKGYSRQATVFTDFSVTPGVSGLSVICLFQEKVLHRKLFLINSNSRYDRAHIKQSSHQH